MDQARCHCGLPLHYEDKVLERHMLDRVRVLGEFVAVTVGGRTWSVQRHYVALHGLNAADLPTLGFHEGFTCPRCHQTSWHPVDVDERHCVHCHYIEGSVR
jgi:hypothetical protein